MVMVPGVPEGSNNVYPASLDTGCCVNAPLRRTALGPTVRCHSVVSAMPFRAMVEAGCRVFKLTQPHSIAGFTGGMTDPEPLVVLSGLLFQDTRGRVHRSHAIASCLVKGGPAEIVIGQTDLRQMGFGLGYDAGPNTVQYTEFRELVPKRQGVIEVVGVVRHAPRPGAPGLRP